MSIECIKTPLIHGSWAFKNESNGSSKEEGTCIGKILNNAYVQLERLYGSNESKENKSVKKDPGLKFSVAGKFLGASLLSLVDCVVSLALTILTTPLAFCEKSRPLPSAFLDRTKFAGKESWTAIKNTYYAIKS